MRHSIRSNTPNAASAGHRDPRPAATNAGTPDVRDQERAILVGILLPDTKADLRDPLGELKALAESAGVAIAGQTIQKRTAYAAGHAIGKGKIEEVAELIQAVGANLVIFDNDLLPRQIRNLEEAWRVKVIDRTELILDIFATHARSRQAQLQVELAQLEYTAPRLRGMWQHLERVAGAGGGTAAGAVGGVGTRGPGERQIEIDRRLVRKRISHLREQLAEIDQRKIREVRARRDQYTVSVVGYTNAGKSTLMNRLTPAGVYAADRLFATLDTKTAKWDLGDGRSALLSDTVGFIRDLPPTLVASFRATLEEAIHADLLLHVVDISSPVAFAQMQAVDEVLKSIGCDTIPQITLLNKVDCMDDASMAELLARHRRECCLRISALTGQGMDELRQEVLQRMQGRELTAVVQMPYSTSGKLLAELQRYGEVGERRYLEDMVEVDLRINRDQFAQLRARYHDLVAKEVRAEGQVGDRAASQECDGPNPPDGSASP
ncbi:MAG: GTPase HflX [Phycisphaerae bacterium]|nr:GTPase HflX [Phycisphaerae bacterium]